LRSGDFFFVSSRMTPSFDLHIGNDKQLLFEPPSPHGSCEMHNNPHYSDDDEARDNQSRLS